MKALILNSGLGARLGDTTKQIPKCLLKLYNNETILHRQLRILINSGIKDFVITTGPFEDQIEAEIQEFKSNNGINIKLVNNSDYRITNYIVSIHKAKNELTDDILLLHGDLVFNTELIRKVLSDKRNNICLYNEKIDLPDKDFKGRFNGNKLLEISVSIFDNNCRAFQPIYKLDKNTMSEWLNVIDTFIYNGNTKVYAEDALNTILNQIDIQGLSYKNDYVNEIDNLEDYNRVNKEIKDFES